MKICTWNVNSLRVRIEHVLRLIRDEQPDVLCLQEIKMEDGLFPRDLFAQEGYAAYCFGQKTYNGVAMICKQPLQEVSCGIPGYSDPQSRVISARIGGVQVVNIYAPNGQAVGADKFVYKLEWYRHLIEWIGRSPDQAWVITGDFNIAPTDDDVYDPVAWKDSILCSEPEREQFRQLLGLGLVDCERVLHPEAKNYTWWDYRMASFRRNFGIRIDHLLASQALAGSIREVRVLKDMRRLEKPSDHAPLWVEFDFSEQVNEH